MKIEVSFTMRRTSKIPAVNVDGVVCMDKTFICSEDIRTFSVIKGDSQEITLHIEAVGWVDSEGNYHSLRKEACSSHDKLMVDFTVAENASITNVRAVVVCN